MNCDDILTEPWMKAFLQHLTLGKLNGSYDMAMKTISVLERIVKDCQWGTAKELIDVVHCVGSEIKKADPTETVPFNMVLRLLKVIRDEYENAFGRQVVQESEDSLREIMTVHEDDVCEYEKQFENLKEAILDNISEIISELDTSGENIATQSLEHIHSNESIMTMGKSKSVEAFLKFAAKRQRKFQVIVAECAPFCNGHELAVSLSKAGIATTLIPDSAIFSLMSRVNKVVIGTHSVMANGGLKAVSGAFSLALAAKHYSVPLIVCTGMFKLTPEYLVSHDQEAFNKFASPHQINSFRNGNIISNCEVTNPVFDYVPPELVTIFVTNLGGNSPSYIYRLLSEIYHRKDYLFQTD